MPPTPKFVSVVNDGRKATPLSFWRVRRKWHFKRCRESESGGLLRWVPNGCASTPVESILGSNNPGRVDAQTNCRTMHAGALHATTKVSSAGGRALESSASNFRLLVYLNC